MQVTVPNFPVPSLPSSRGAKQEKGLLDGDIRWSLEGDWIVSMLGANGTCHEYKIAPPKVFQVRDEKAKGGLPEKRTARSQNQLGSLARGRSSRVKGRPLRS